MLDIPSISPGIDVGPAVGGVWRCSARCNGPRQSVLDVACPRGWWPCMAIVADVEHWVRLVKW